MDLLPWAAVILGDNTAPNFLPGKLGGPAGPPGPCRSLGDSVTRLDRTEPALNTSYPGDLRDTTSPHAMVSLMQTVLCGVVLTAQEHSLPTGEIGRSTVANCSPPRSATAR